MSEIHLAKQEIRSLEQEFIKSFFILAWIIIVQLLENLIKSYSAQAP